VSNHTPRPTYLLALRPDVRDPRPAVTLKKALKMLLRGYGLRCLSVTEQKPAPAGEVAPGASVGDGKATP